jgi:hypothetical protein
VNALTREDFAAMTGAAYVPLCESAHNCHRLSSHYVETRHQCFLAEDEDRLVYPVCREVVWSILGNTGRTALCPLCGNAIPQKDFVTLAAQVDTRP